MGRIIRFFLYGFLIASIAASIILWRTPFSLKPHAFSPPEQTTWKPIGPREVRTENQVTGSGAYFRSLHCDSHNSDEVMSAIAPMFEKAWSTEPFMYIAEGPTMDKDGNLYFSPITPNEEVILVSLDGKTGERRWALKGRDNGGGAPIILNDPDTDGQVIYHGNYVKAYAVRPDGSIIWEAPTGLDEYDIKEGGIPKHNFGLNYLPKADALVGVTGDGTVYVLDRKTGEQLLVQPFVLPGSNAKPEKDRRPAEFIVKRINKLMDETFLPMFNGKGRFDTMLDALLGGGTKVANYFSIDVNTSRMFIAATSPDGDDGKVDGVSGFGSLYALELVPQKDKYELKIVARTSFDGGTAATPALNASGTRVYTADNFGNILAYDRDLNELWRLDVKEQVVASVTVASDNHEIYAVTLYDVIKIIDKGTSGEIKWKADLNMYPKRLGQQNLNLLTATVAPNGVAVQVGSGYVKGALPMPLTVGIALIDRATGEVRYFLEGGEESVSVTNIGPDGSIIIGHSPFRRAVTYSLLGFKMKPISGGVTKFRPIRLDLLARDALRAAADRATNAAAVKKEHPESAKADIRQITILLNQALLALPVAVRDNDMTAAEADKISRPLTILLSKLDLDTLTDAAQVLNNICSRFDASAKHKQEI